jgi:glycosyltransferase involved in cell wall biosynthesis
MQPSPKYLANQPHGPYSWINNLFAALSRKSEIELALVGPGDSGCEPYTADGARCYDIVQQYPKNRPARLLANWKLSIDLPGWRQIAARAIKDFKPDVIHIHGTENPFGLLAADSSVPVVISLQGLLDECRRFVFGGIDCIERLRLFTSKDALLGCGITHGYLRHLKMARRELAIFRLGKHFIGRTEWDRAVTLFENPMAKYYHCDEIIRPEFYESCWEGSKTDQNVLYTTSSSMLWKGAEVFLEALSILIKADRKDLHARIAGVPAGSEVDNFLRKREKKYGLEQGQHVSWLGRLSASEIVAEIQKSALFVYPSHIDNSPNALCEAMLMGAPCVAASVGGIPTLIENKSTGLLYDDKDPYALAGQIKYVLENRGEANLLGLAAREVALKRHDPELIANNMLEIYQEVAGGR